MSVPFLINTPLATIGGAAWINSNASGRDGPLVVALHGGGFGKAYFTGVHPLPPVALANGADVVLLDRPGANQSRFQSRQGDILSDNAAALDDAVAELWERYGASRSGVFLIGHSIGGAIALMLAARSPAWPLIGVSVSGVGDRPPASIPFASDVSGETQPRLPRPALAQVMMAPGAATEAVLDALETASIPAVTEELAAIYTVWPPAATRVLAAIERPVQITLSQHEPLWKSDAAAIDRLRGIRAASADQVACWPDVGHCIDFHPQAPAFHDAIFAFMRASQDAFSRT